MSSSDVIARARMFYCRAEELADKGHLLRAAENYGRGAEAASALGPDNLVALDFKLRQGNMLCCFATAPESAPVDPRVLEAYRAECIALYSGARSRRGAPVLAATHRRSPSFVEPSPRSS